MPVRWLFALPPLFLLIWCFKKKPAKSSVFAPAAPTSAPAPWVWLSLFLAGLVLAFQPMNFDEHNLLVRVLVHDPRFAGNHYLAQAISEFVVPLVGQSWIAARLPSLFFSLVSLFLWIRCANANLGSLAGTGFALALLANGLFLFNAVSNRAYPLGLFLSSLWLTYLIRFTERNRGRDAVAAGASFFLLVALGGHVHRMLYFTAVVGTVSFLFWHGRNRSAAQAGMIFSGAILLVWIAWPYLWDVFLWEWGTGHALRGIPLGRADWRKLESLSFLYVFGWDRAWQAFLGFGFVVALLYERIKNGAPTFGECFWIFLLLSLPATGWGVGEFQWEPRFFFFFLVPGLFFLAQSVERISPARRPPFVATAVFLFILIPFWQAPRVFGNSGGQRELVDFLDEAAHRVSAVPSSCVACSGSATMCRWVRYIYLAESRGFRWGNDCVHRWVVRIAGNDTVPMPRAELRLNFGYRKDYLLYEYASP